MAFRFNKVEPGIEMADPGGDIQMKGEYIEQIAPPWNGLAFAIELETGETRNRPNRAVLAGNPFWIVKSQRPRLDRDDFVDAKNLLLGLGRIHRERNRFTGQ